MIPDLSNIARGAVVVLGVGNALRGDDAAGPLAAEMLRKRFPSAVFDAGQAPENFVGPIRRAAPDAVLLIDAADFSGGPGEVRLVGAAQVEGVAFATHGMPLSLVMSMIEEETGAACHLIAIQAARSGLGETMTDDVRDAVRELVVELGRLLERGGEQ